MTLVQETHIIAAILWLLILIGPPVTLGMLASMLYLDGATRGINAVAVKPDNRATLLLILAAFTAWISLLKFVFLPMIGFDTQFLTPDGATRYNYSDLHSLTVLWNLSLAWLGRATLQALALLAALVLVYVAVLFVARAMGRAAAIPPHRKTQWR